jgi:hypothetical protein
MKDHREMMIGALKQVFIPDLRARGFKGSFPHFRRALAGRVDYLTVQFYSSGGSFVVEIAAAGPDGKPRGHGKRLPIDKLNVQYFSKRLRLGSKPESGNSDNWYVFGPRNYEPSTPLQATEHYLGIARQAMEDLERQGEPWFVANSGVA